MPKFSEDDEFEAKERVAKTATDIQRIRLEKLLRHPDKLVTIPERPKEAEFPKPPEFVRNVVGSSAGAGSGEYHIYRNLRKREYARLEFIEKKANKEEADKAFEERAAQRKREAEEKTAKRRAKRQKKKEKAKQIKKMKKESKVANDEAQNESDSEDDDDEEKKDAKGEKSSDKEEEEQPSSDDNAS